MPVKYNPICTISICYFKNIVNNENMDETVKKALNQNLIDSGCTKEVLDEFFLLFEQKRKKEALRLLAKHKAELLDNLHDSQNKIDCLDYLIFNLNQN